MEKKINAKTSWNRRDTERDEERGAVRDLKKKESWVQARNYGWLVIWIKGTVMFLEDSDLTLCKDIYPVCIHHRV